MQIMHISLSVGRRLPNENAHVSFNKNAHISECRPKTAPVDKRRTRDRFPYRQKYCGSRDFPIGSRAQSKS